MLCALIMAGGIGSRFWPLSTKEKPKQFLKLLDEETMIQKTVGRILDIIPMERIFVCTGEKYTELVKEQLPDLPTRNIIVEPESRNTAPCITLSSMIINKYYKNCEILVLPSDHVIENDKEFRKIVKETEKILDEKDEALVTFGMLPTRAEIGYGYIKPNDFNKNFNVSSYYKVDKFVEKPNLEKAKEYLKDGDYLWNSGMFMWKTMGILGKVKKFLPNTYEALSELEVCSEDDISKIIKKNYYKTDKISIDFGILEKSDDIYVIPTNVGWDDVGTLEAIERYRHKDTNGNIAIGDCKFISGQNNLIVASEQRIIINGLSEIYAVESNGNIIIGPKEKFKDIKMLKNNV